MDKIFQIINIKYFDKEMIRITPTLNGDWIDLRSAQDYNVPKGTFQLIKLGVAMQLPEDFEAYIAPRSSSYKKFGFIQTNSMGVIDNSYCGNNDEWCLPIYALDRDVIIHKNDRICQFRIMKKMPEILMQEVESLSNEDRGGFGSTGIN